MLSRIVWAALVVEMTSHLLEAYRADIDTRTNADGNQRTFADGYNSRSPEELQADMMKHYAGHFVIGRDLDVY